MIPIMRALLAFAVSLVQSRVSLQVEILALRHQLGVYHRSLRLAIPKNHICMIQRSRAPWPHLPPQKATSTTPIVTVPATQEASQQRNREAKVLSGKLDQRPVEERLADSSIRNH